MDEVLKTKTHMCRKCYGSFEKLQKSRRDLAKLEGDLCYMLERSYRAYSEAPAAPTDVCSRSPPTPPIHMSQQCQTPRRRYIRSTPVRRLIQRKASTSPSVVVGVRSAYMYYIVYFKVVEKTKKSSHVRRITNSMRTLCRSVGRGRRSSVVNQVMKDKVMRQIAVNKIGKLLRKELISSCGVKSQTLFSGGIDDLKIFSWDKMAADLKRTAPVLHSLLEHCLSANRSQVRSLNSKILMSLIGGILLRNANERVNIIQKLLSIILAASHAPKHVSVMTLFIIQCTIISM